MTLMTIQVRKVPEAVHRSLRERAASNGVSLSDYVLRELERVAARPPIADVLQRAEQIPGHVAAGDTVAAIREQRDRE